MCDNTPSQVTFLSLWLMVDEMLHISLCLSPLHKHAVDNSFKLANSIKPIQKARICSRIQGWVQELGQNPLQKGWYIVQGQQEQSGKDQSVVRE